MSVKLYASGKSRIESLPVRDRGKILSWLMDFSENVHGWGNRVHRVERRQGVWTARIDDDYRAVLVQDREVWCVVYVGRHDDAYRWAERHEVRIDDGEAIVVFTAEALEEIQAPVHVQRDDRPQPILSDKVVSDAVLEGWGIPPTPIAILRSITDVETLLEYVTNLPEQVADRLLGAACGDVPAEGNEAGAGLAPDEVAAPAKLDIRRTFYIVDGNEDLLRVIDQPMASWIAFLHPSQHRVAYGRFKGPVKVSGSAGTGKTVVALHRARHLARQGKRVLLTTYADTLCANLREQLALLCSPDELELIRVSTVHEVALGLLRAAGAEPKPDREGLTEKWLKEIADYEDYARSPEWYVMEWEHVVHAHGVCSLDEYLAVSRQGRGSALQERDRRVVWGVFEKLFERLEAAGITDWATICLRARESLEDGDIERPADVVVVDEMQDLRPQELRFLSALGGSGDDGLMLVGDMTQRIFVPRFTMKAAGIDVIGRSFCLRINYRTTLQIRELADSVVAGGLGRRGPDGAVSVYRGPKPTVRTFDDTQAEAEYVADAVNKTLRADDREAHDVAVFVRTACALKPFVTALEAKGVKTHSLSRQAPPDGHVRVGSMHRAKGLEFKSVFVVGVSADAVPDPATVQHLFEPAALDEAMERERQMLYVALTRARDDLTVTWTGERSCFLSGLRGASPRNGGDT